MLKGKYQKNVKKVYACLLSIKYAWLKSYVNDFDDREMSPQKRILFLVVDVYYNKLYLLLYFENHQLKSEFFLFI